MVTGACLCGAIRYEIDGPLGQLHHCHCSRCRKHHGAPFASFVAVPMSALVWLSGEDKVQTFESSADRERPFCQICGSVVPTQVGDRMLVPAGNLAGELATAGAFHMFVASKPPWRLVSGDLPQYPAAPPGWRTDLPDLARPLLEDATHGSCSCGKVTFSLRGTPGRWMQCHCSRCRRGRSAAHGSNCFYALDQFHWETGKELVQRYKVPEAERFMVCFCAECGGGTPVERDGVPFIQVAAGLLDQDPGHRPEAHIHIASKAPWYTVSDDLPQFPELPS